MIHDLKLKVYGGLSIRPSDARSIFPVADFQGPIQRGNLKIDIENGLHAVAIIDGAFEQDLAVSPMEIIDAMRSGIKVYGSSSMGALRGAELENHGMVGFGRIFDHIRTNPKFRDDYLGLVFGKLDSELILFTLPFIDFYFCLIDKSKMFKTSKKEISILLKHYEELHYSERNEHNLKKCLNENQLKKLTPIIQSIFNSKQLQKQKDAKGLLKFMRKDLHAINSFNRAYGKI